jgi:DNA-directed RNA polymerase subunit RPC12/RpoP
MSKVKMRCITCGKWFQSANAKDVTCPDCTQKARKEKQAAKNAVSNTNKPVGASGQVAPAPVRPVPAKPKPPTHSGTSQWLDSLNDVKVGQPEQPPARPKITPPPAPREDRSGPGKYQGPGGYREDRGPGGYRNDRSPAGYREGGYKGPGGYREDRPGPYRVIGGNGLPDTAVQRPRFPQEGKPPRGPRPDKGPEGQRGPQKPRPKAKTPRPPAPPKPKKEKTPPPLPFVPTAEQVAQIELRYLELAQPTEFDGIRTQIANEMGIPKKAVKKVVKELRERQSIPSWWETQIYKGPAEEKEKIKALYEPLLPVPPVGVHKTIAEQLSLKPGDVYQAIKTIRLELNLPQYNDPALHEGELKPIRPSQPATLASETQPESAQPAEISVEQPAEAVPADEKPADQLTEPVQTEEKTAEPVSVADAAKESAE